jgi:hypothetical protein
VRKSRATARREEIMIRVTVEYDAYNRTFKLIDRDFGSILEDGSRYELTLPFVLPDLGEDPQLTSVCDVPPNN